MKCDLCGANEAEVHLTEIRNGRKVERHLCLQCASKETGVEGADDVRKLLTEWVKHQAEKGKPPMPPQ